MKNLCVLFDMDGTLLDSGEGITNAVEYAVSKFGKPALDMETKNRFVGPPLRESFAKYCGVSADDAEVMVSLYREYYSAGGLFECKPYEGIENLLSFLNKSGCDLYVATAKPQEYADKMLKKWDLFKYFKEVVGASFDKSRDDKKVIIGEIIAKEKEKTAVMVGDTKFDVEAAHKNKIDAVFVTYGYGTDEDVKLSNPEYIAENTEQIKEILQKIMAGK